MNTTYLIIFIGAVCILVLIVYVIALRGTIDEITGGLMIDDHYKRIQARKKLERRDAKRAAKELNKK